jgi:hypothetical protein
MQGRNGSMQREARRIRDALLVMAGSSLTLYVPSFLLFSHPVCYREQRYTFKCDDLQRSLLLALGELRNDPTGGQCVVVDMTGHLRELNQRERELDKMSTRANIAWLLFRSKGGELNAFASRPVS